MNIYQKLMACRLQLQEMKLKKSGKNTFSNYDYFELQDFLPKINELFAAQKLCSIVAFTTDIATLTVIDAEKPEDAILFTSPMSEASLKGCHAIQNLGAVETYQRRYLYMMALEIVECDTLEPVTGNKETVEIHTCEDCQGEITPTSKSTVSEILAKGQKYYKKNLCSKCISKRYQASMASGQ